MGRFRAKIREGRRALHEYMSVPALYFSWPNPAEIREISVRVHDKRQALGDLKGTSFNYAEREDDSPRIVFMRSEVDRPVRNMIVSIEPGVAYRLGVNEAPDDITITNKCTRLEPEDALAPGFPSPPPIV